MVARDANDATWYVLRYAEDFASLDTATLLFDEARGVLELAPEAPAVRAEPPPGIAVDLSGEIYRVDEDGRLVVVYCDGSIRELVCEPGIVAQPAGLALDRRGYLYVADPAAHRVLVLLPEDASVAAILTGGGAAGPLVEPVDVAVAPTGRIYVADRAAGRIFVFSASMRPIASFATATVQGGEARPIAVMVDADGALLVADAFYPRLLRYAPDGTRLGDLSLVSQLAPLSGGDLAARALGIAWGEPLPRLHLGACGPCVAPNESSLRIAEVHRALRLLALSLGRCFATEGVFVSAALDSGRPDTLWHRIEVELAAEPPAGTSVTVETFTSNRPTPVSPDWAAPRDPSGKLLPFSTSLPEQIVQSPRGRYCWLRVTLRSAEGTATPSVCAIRALYPRQSYLDLLPAAYRRDPEGALFLDRFLALFERVLTGVEDRYEAFSRWLNPDAAPAELVEWLAALVDLAFDPSWPLARRRALLAEAMDLYRTRGTVAGLERYVELYTGKRPLLLEGFLERPQSPAYLGRSGSLVGASLALVSPGSATLAPERVLWDQYAHRFTVVAYLDDRCDEQTVLRAIDRIVEVNKPAHTAHRIEAVYANARVGLQARAGIDLVLGAPEPHAARAGGGASVSSEKGKEENAVLGVDTVLGGRRGGATRRPGEEL